MRSRLLLSWLCVTLAASASAADVEKIAPAGAPAGSAVRAAASVAPGADGTLLPALLLQGADAAEQPASSASAGEAALAQAAARGDLPLLQRAASAPGGETLLRLRDDTGRMRLTATKAENVDTGTTIWADFFEGAGHPLRRALAERLSVQAQDGPRIAKGSVHLTARGMEGQETMRLHAGEGLLLTTHDGPSVSVDKTMSLLADSGSHKSSKQLLGLVLADVIRSYGETIESLAADFHALTRKLDEKSTDDSVLKDAVAVGQKIDRMRETVQLQKRELQEALSQNEFHDSPLVPADSLREQIKALDHHLTALDHYQDRKNGLIDLYRAKVSNDLDDAMKRLAAFGVLFSPYAVVAGFMGMNVGIPGATIPGMFWMLLAGATGVAAAMVAVMKRKGWL